MFRIFRRLAFQWNVIRHRESTPSCLSERQRILEDEVKSHHSIIEMSEEPLEEWESSHPEEFQAMLDEYVKNRPPRCTPDTCGSACQGMGWCYTCEDFRGELPDDHMEELMG